MRTSPDRIIDGFDPTYYLLTQPDVAAAGVDPLAHFLAYGWKEGRLPNGLFDPVFYLSQNPDVAAAGMNPLQHYLLYGAKEGRDPSATFDTSTYLAANPDVAAAGVNPLIHYLAYGAFEGRSGGANPTVGTSANDYLIGTSGAETVNAGAGNDIIVTGRGDDTVDGGAGTDTARFAGNFLDYTITFNGDQVIVDGPEGHDVFTNVERFSFRDVAFDNRVNSFFDEFYYYAINKDVYAAGVDAAAHYAQYGWKEGRDPNAYFDTSYYLSQNPDVAAAGVNPLSHYLTFGAIEGRNPSAQFDTIAYLAANPDVAASGMNPLLHFLIYGKSEGRSPVGSLQTSVTSLEDTDKIFASGDFDFGDLASVQSVDIDVSALANGILFLDANDDRVIDSGEALTGSSNLVSIADIAANRLVFRPADDAAGSALATFHYVGSDGTSTSTPGIMTINVTPVNDAPVVTAGSGLSYTENQAATAIAATLTLSDVDNTTLTGATVSITGNFASGQDVLAFTSQNGITGNYNSSTGVLTLSGTATVAQYQAALRSVTYANSSDDPSTAARTISFQVDDGQSANHASNVSTATVNVTTVNDAPVVDGQSASVDFTENGAAVAIAAALTLSDVDSTTLAGATVSITTNFASGEDALNFVDQNGITGNYNSATGVLTLSGSASLADYQAALRSVTYSNSSDAPSVAARTISFEVDDGGSANNASNISTASVSITPVNDAPVGADNTITIDEDAVYSFTAADFGFSDLTDGAAHNLEAVIIKSLPLVGTLVLLVDGIPEPVALDQVVLADDIHTLTFIPDADENGAAYASFDFLVQDDGGTANGGVDTSTSVKTITFDVTALNDGPRSVAFTQAAILPEGTVAADNFNGDGVVGTVSATDIEGDTPLTFALVDENGDPYVGPFAIDPTTGQITVTTTDPLAIDYEAHDAHSFELTVKVTDALGALSLQTISIVLGDVEPEPNGSGQDGYIAGATVFIDTDDNGEWDAGEYKTTTDAFGNFKIIGSHTGTLYMEGGTDLATNLAFTGVMRAPSGSTVITPLTTLIVALMEANPGMTVADATAALVNALGVPDLDYTSYDPVAASLQGDVDGDKVFAAGVQVYSTVVQASSLIVGASSSSVSASDAANAVLGALVTTIANASGTISLADNLVLTDVINAAATTTSVDVTQTASGAAGVIAGTNGIIQTAVTGSTGLELLTAVSGAGNVAQGGAASALFTAGQNNDTDAATAAYTGGALDTAVADATANVDTNAVKGPNGNLKIVGTASPDVLQGNIGNDTLLGGGGRDLLAGGAGDDWLYGDWLDADDVTHDPIGTRSMGFDRADYSANIGKINVQLTAGLVQEYDAGGTTIVSTDHLFSIEGVVGTVFDDTFDATGFSATSTNGGGIGFQNANGLGGMGNVNQFEGGGGNDTITGNGATRISYQNATAGVTVSMTSLGAGTATGNASVGTDTFTGVNQVRGSNFNDTISGSNNGGTSTSVEQFDPLGGSDTINGRGGFDRVRYNNQVGSPFRIEVELGTGVVNKYDVATASLIGTDQLYSIESVRGTDANDIYDARTFGAMSTNGGNNNWTGSGFGTPFTGPQAQGNFNEFEGMGGNDIIYGNGNTRVSYSNATAGVTVVFTGFGLGTATGDASVGTDTFMGGIASVRGSNFGDVFFGSNNGTNNFEQFEGMAGDDHIDGGAGVDMALYNNNNGDGAGVPLGSEGMQFLMAAGSATAVSGNSAATFNYGTDTLRSIEAIRGTSANDVYDARGFTTTSTNAGSVASFPDGTAFNQFDGGLGDDEVWGNGATRVSYQNASGAVTVNLATGSSGADGNDVFHGGINAVRGSNFNDGLTGTNNATGTNEFFEGWGGNDFINGLGGFDVARYDNHSTSGFGISLTRDSGDSTRFTVVRQSAGAGDGVGTDTLVNIEGVRGTNFNDIYDATGYTANTGFGAGFNEFEGMGGNDDITGNGNTRVSYQNASGSVNVNLDTGATGAAGTDTFHGGINAVRGSQFGDTIRGRAGANDILTGLGGNDTFVFDTTSFGNDTITDFVAGAGTDDVMQFSTSVFADYNTVMAASAQVGSNVVITLNAGNSITLQNVSLSSLHLSDFVFV